MRLPKEVIEKMTKSGLLINPSNEFDPVKKPKHYNLENKETITYIKDKLNAEEFKGYIKGNVLKYISREAHKGGLEDLKKARWYLDYLIKEI